MAYTIARMQECGTVELPMVMEIRETSRGYEVALGRDGVWTSQVFDGLLDAYKVFERLSCWIIMGCYSDKARRSYLETGTMA
jgi:hypothetical protein